MTVHTLGQAALRAGIVISITFTVIVLAYTILVWVDQHR